MLPGVVNKVIMRSECLKEVFSELDMSSDVLEIFMSPDPPYFRLSTFGSYGTNHVSFIVFIFLLFCNYEKKFLLHMMCSFNNGGLGLSVYPSIICNSFIYMG